MSRKIILISLDWTRPKDPAQSLGHASILANLLEHNIDVISSPSFSSHEYERMQIIADSLQIYNQLKKEERADSVGRG